MKCRRYFSGHPQKLNCGSSCLNFSVRRAGFIRAGFIRAGFDQLQQSSDRTERVNSYRDCPPSSTADPIADKQDSAAKMLATRFVALGKVVDALNLDLMLCL